MSKAVITWNLSEFDENQDFKRFVMSRDMAMMLYELKHNSYKKCQRLIDKSEDDELYVIFEYINSLFEEYNVDINDIID